MLLAIVAVSVVIIDIAAIVVALTGVASAIFVSWKGVKVKIVGKEDKDGISDESGVGN